MASPTRPSTLLLPLARKRSRQLERPEPDELYEWKRRFQTQGFEGLKDLPPIHRSHPQTTPVEVVERIKIKALALEHPAITVVGAYGELVTTRYGCNRHEALLAVEGMRVS